MTDTIKPLAVGYIAQLTAAPASTGDMAIYDAIANHYSGRLFTQAELDAAVAAEREACAKLCENVSELHCIVNNTYFADQCAIAIRRRSRRKEPL